MYEPFPGNYAWNLAINICLGMGGAIGEIDQANQVLRSIAEEGADKGTEAFFRSWGELADRLVVLGEEAESMGHPASASEKYCRASAYYLTAERMQSRHYAPRAEMYRKMLNTIERAITVGDLGCQRVEIAFSQKSFPALFVKGHGEGPHPCMIFCNGLDSTKEMIFLTMRQELAKRGVSCLMVDQPGAGEALRIAGLTAIADSEKWAAACVDYLESRSDVDRKRIGMMGCRSGAITHHVLPHTRSVWPYASPGAPITTGVRCSSDASPARELAQCRIIGIMSCGSGAITTWTSSCVSFPRCR